MGLPATVEKYSLVALRDWDASGTEVTDSQFFGGIDGIRWSRTMVASRTRDWLTHTSKRPRYSCIWKALHRYTMSPSQTTHSKPATGSSAPSEWIAAAEYPAGTVRVASAGEAVDTGLSTWERALT